MPRTSSTDSNSPPSSTSTSQSRRLSSLTSFLPKSFGGAPLPPPTATTSSIPEKKKKRKRVIQSSSEDDEVEILDHAPPPRTTKKREKVKRSQVIDLTGTDDDDIEMPPPPKPSKKKQKKPPPVEKKLDKGKGKLSPDSHTQDDDGSVMWVDKFFPTCKEELAIHSKKLSEVSNWFEETFPSSGIPTKLSSKYRRLLVLSGPSGSGKTSCLRILAQEFEVEILEWKEDSQVLNANDDYSESMIQKFNSFLTRAGMVPSLEFTNPDSSDEEGAQQSPVASTSSNLKAEDTPTRRRRLILLEDLPNISHFQTKQAFRSSLLQYLTSPRVNCPLVLIVSEALTRPGIDSLENSGGGGGGGFINRGDENVDSRSVCGLQILQHPACREISFNPIAQTIMKKALNRILDQIYSSSTSTSTSTSTLSPRPSAGTLDLIIQNSNGDIRSALMSLQFLSTLKDASSGLLVQSSSNKKGIKKKSKNEASGGGGKELLQFVTSRENSLFIFHALGKVLYNKRWGESSLDDKKDLNRPGILQEKSPDGKLPKHLRTEWQRKPSKVDPDVLFAEAPIDAEVFLTYLHHNFPQFTSTSIESCSSILDSLSTSDSLYQLDHNSNDPGGGGGRRNGLTSLYSFDQAVRGTLLGLPSPVLREKQVLRKSDWWEMERLRKENLNGVQELLTPTSIIVGGEEGEEFGILNSRGGGGNRKSLFTELIPWLGVIKPSNVNPFLIDLAQFPPLSFDSSITGTALSEKDIKLEEGEEDDGAVDEGPRKLEEIEDEEGVKVLDTTTGDNWYEEEDDIVDSD
ncbi:hypothetical protein JCM5350_003916 [Sporobolomyces pararoseus]